MDDVSATYPGSIAWEGGGGAVEGARVSEPTLLTPGMAHGGRPAVDLPLTLVASVLLPGCVVPGAGLVGGTGMGRMEKGGTDGHGPEGDEAGSGARRRWESDSVAPKASIPGLPGPKTPAIHIGP